MSRVLITGGAGAIGFHLSKRLAELGCQVFIADNYSRSVRDRPLEELFKKDNVHEICIDLRDYSAYGVLPEAPDYVYHLAALNGTQNFYERPFDVLESSTTPTINLLRHYADSRTLKRFIYAGSSETYASTVTMFGWPVPTDEMVPLCIEDPLNVRWSYGGSKLHGELATVAAGAQFKLPFTIIRYHNAYGPRMGDKHVIPDFLMRAREGRFELYGYEDTRSFIFVDDVVDATIAVAESERCAAQIVNVGGDQEITMLELAKTMMRLLNSNEDIVCNPSPKGSVRRRAPSLEKLRGLTGFAPRYSLEEGLILTMDYYLKRG